MYKVAIVDDERWAIADILNTFPFEAYGFEVIGQFTNPKQALEALPNHRPDVIFADIRMPALSGLELITLLKEKLPDLIAIVLSGYAEFEYAQKALKLDVFDYCLKPLDEEEATALMRRLAEHISHSAPKEEGQESGDIPEPFERIISYVDEHIFQRLVLEDIAQAHYLNANYCGQLFRQHTGMTFPQYVRDKRLKKACDLLAYSRMPVGVVAVKVGYQNIHYFSRVFAEQMGVTPGQYRKGACS